MTNYSMQRDAAGGSYRHYEKIETSRHNSSHYKGTLNSSKTLRGFRDKERGESGKHREHERDVRVINERLERNRETSWRRDSQSVHHYKKYQEEGIRRQEENYHHYSRQSHGHYYNQHHENYTRTRHATEEFYNARNSTADVFHASTSAGIKIRQHLDEPYDIDEEKEEALRVDRRKRHKTHNLETELADEQTEHDLRSRLLSKRNKFMKGHDVLPEEMEAKEVTKSSHHHRSDAEQHLSEEHHILELQRERIMLRNLLKGTYSNSSEKEEVEDEEEENNSIERTKRSINVRKSGNVLSPTAVAAQVTAGLKDLTGLKKSNTTTTATTTTTKKMTSKTNSMNNEISTYSIVSATENELDLVTDESECTNSKHSEDNDSDQQNNEKNPLNNNSSSKTKKLKKKKKKKKKKRHISASDIEILSEVQLSGDENTQSINYEDKTTVVIRDSSESEREHYKNQQQQQNYRQHNKRTTEQLSPAALSISTGKSSSSSINSQKSIDKRKIHKKNLVRQSSIETVSDASKSVSGLSSRASSHNGSRSNSRTRARARTRQAARRHSYSRSISTDSEGTRSSHSQQNYAQNMRAHENKRNSKSTEREMKLEKSNNNTNNNNGNGNVNEVILEEEDLNLPNYFPGVQGCRSVEEFQCLNRIEEGTYGVVYRAKDKRTNEIVALKRLKMEKEKEGFPITSLREINTLLKGQHPNIVHVREIVVGSNMDKIFIVMDYVEHDLKSLMETMKQRKQNFLPSEVKCLVQQLLRAVAHLHDNWILHRDLKTSNLLLSHKGILKVGDFGLAREYGSPLKRYTLLVVTLWYRAPELLLCALEYSTPIDMWSVGCIFAELLLMKPLFNGESEIDQLHRIFKELGTPDEVNWPGFKQLPAYKNILTQNSQMMEYKNSNLNKRFGESVSELGIELLKGMLTCNPTKRLTAEAALRSPYFSELPLPIDPSMFPTWPAKSELGARKTAPSPKPPSGGRSRFPNAMDNNSANNAAAAKAVAGGNTRILSSIITGNKKTGTNTGFVLNAGLEQRRLDLLRNLNKK